jgi:hypothetical protein
LLADAEKRFGRIKAHLALYAGRFRRSTAAEREAVGGGFIPDIRPLGRAATAADVKAGRAVFHLDGKGKPLTLKLPAVAELKGGKGLIVQAETLDGKPVYGVILREEIRRVEAKEVVKVTPLPK